MVKIRRAAPGDEEALSLLILKFRQSLAELRGKPSDSNLASAEAELNEHLQANYPIFVADAENGALAGYLVCRVDQDVIWAESLYVEPDFRRLGIGSHLYAEAEKLAASLGEEAPYNWVDPDNSVIIAFLQKRGYTVLNLIELRRPRRGEEFDHKIAVGLNEFDHY